MPILYPDIIIMRIMICVEKEGARGMRLAGRRVIYTDYATVDASNVLDVLTYAMSIHMQNAQEINYLYWYERNVQPILERKKEINGSITNRIVVNHANEIVSFKSGYLMGEPVQYVSYDSTVESAEAVRKLNSYMFSEDKACKDKELADWFHICGTSYRMCMPDLEGEEDEAPFEIYTLDPRSAFVVYWSGLGNKPVMGVKYVTDRLGNTTYSCYTDKMYFEVRGNGLVKAEPHDIGRIPIVEYPLNSSRLGAFEIVITQLDALNTLESNRMDGVEQFIQSLLMLKNVDINGDQFKELKEQGGICVPADGDVKYLTQELNQTQTQTLADSIYQEVLVICGMPNRNGGSMSDVRSVGSVIMRDGWQNAEARAKDTEHMFKAAEKQFLRIALGILAKSKKINLKLSQIDIRFTRRNYENIQEKSQVLLTMLASDQIAPRLAFEHCGMFPDPEVAYQMSQEYYEEQQKKAEREMLAAGQADEEATFEKTSANGVNDDV